MEHGGHSESTAYTARFQDDNQESDNMMLRPPVRCERRDPVLKPSNTEGTAKALRTQRDFRMIIKKSDNMMLRPPVRCGPLRTPSSCIKAIEPRGHSKSTAYTAGFQDCNQESDDLMLRRIRCGPLRTPCSCIKAREHGGTAKALRTLRDLLRRVRCGPLRTP